MLTHLINNEEDPNVENTKANLTHEIDVEVGILEATGVTFVQVTQALCPERSLQNKII
jgi:hypothetical protein